MVQLCNLGVRLCENSKGRRKSYEKPCLGPPSMHLPPPGFRAALELRPLPWSLPEPCHSHTVPGLNTLLLLTLSCWIPVLISDLLWHYELVWWSLGYQLNLVTITGPVLLLLSAEGLCHSSVRSRPCLLCGHLWLLASTLRKVAYLCCSLLVLLQADKSPTPNGKSPSESRLKDKE